MKTFTKIFTDKNFPFLELRYSNSNEHYKKHFHETFSLGVNKEGLSIYTNEDKDYNLGSNMISIINPNVVHSCNSCLEVLNVFYMMYLDKQWCANIQRSINAEVKEFVPIPEDILESKDFYIRYIELCENLFSSLLIQEKENELINFMFDFFCLYLKEVKNEVKDESFEIYEKILHFLNENYKENISLQDLSQEFDLNPFYIIRLFKKQMNLTPHSYLLNVKVNKAKKYLQEGYSIIITAQECGFFDQSHFHKNFYKITTITPKEYKLNFVH